MSAAHPPLRDSYAGLLNRAQLARRSGDWTSSIALYRRLVERLGRLSDTILDRRPDLGQMHLQAGTELAEMLRLEARYAEAYEVRARLLDRHPDLAEEWRQENAVLRIAKGDVDAGLAELKCLVEEEPDDAGGWLVLGRESRIEGRFSDSEAALDRALKAADGDDQSIAADVHFQRFLLYRDMGRLDDAAAAWEQVVEVDSARSATVRQVYTMYTTAGRYTAAKRYLALDDNPLQAGLQQGLIAELTGNRTQAEEAWRKVADLDPNAFEHGQDCWVEAVLRLKDQDRALEQLQTMLAQDLTPRLLILSGVGWAMRGDRELASMLLQQAINLLRRQRPSKQKLDSSDWRLLDSLVADDEIKNALKPYFAVVETIWA